MKRLTCAGMTLFLVSLFLLAPAFAASARKKETLEDFSRDAYIWAYPAVLMSQIRNEMLKKAKDPQASLNHFFFQSNGTPPPLLREFIPENTENIYGWAWVNLGKEPLVLTQPEIKSRFSAVHFVDAFSNVFYVLSNRNTRETRNAFVLTAPGWTGVLPPGTTEIKASTPELLILAQTFLRSQNEVPLLSNMMKQYQLISLSAWKEGRRLQSSELVSVPGEKKESFNRNLALQGGAFFRELQDVLKRNPAPGKSDDQELERLTPLMLKNRTALAALLEEPSSARMIERGMFQGEREIESRLARGVVNKVNGWSYELKANAFDDDFLTRAAAAKISLFSTPPEQIMQMSVHVDEESRQLNSAYRYNLRFEKGAFPVSRSGWSLRIYDSSTKKLADRPRFHSSSHDLDPRLKYNPDGSLDLKVQFEEPAKNEEGNWLALSKNANFYVVMTIYNPGNIILNRKYIAPSLTRVDEDGFERQRIVKRMIAQNSPSD